jgi:hypothetical protein
MINYAATTALCFPTSDFRNKNCRFRLVTSIVSRSITWISLKPDKARSFKISQPNPPAPMHRIGIDLKPSRRSSPGIKLA